MEVQGSALPAGESRERDADALTLRHIRMPMPAAAFSA